MTEPSLLHPELRSRVRPSTILTMSLVAAGATLAGALTVVALQPAPEVSFAVPQIVVSVPPVLDVIAPPVAASAPEPAPTEAPELAPLRSLVPFVAAECVSMNAEELPPQCSLHDGFPAIAGDGSRIAVKHYETVAGAEIAGMSIQLLDAKTSRLVRSEIVVTVAEVEAAGDDTTALRATMKKRADRIQRMLDEGSYRALHPLGNHGAFSEPYPVDATAIHAEFSDTVVRVVDPSSRSILGRLDFSVPAPRKYDPSDDCSGWIYRSIDVAWDPATKTVLGTTEYDGGGCMCDTYEKFTVKHLR